MRQPIKHWKNMEDHCHQFCEDKVSYDVVSQTLPVTALLFERNLLFTAQGGAVQGLDISSNERKVVGVISLFKQSVIYGLTILSSNGERHLLCFGGKFLRIVKIYCDDGLLESELVSAPQFKDWILDVASTTYKRQEPWFLAIALAHNSVVLYNYHEDTVIKEVHCAEKCILYSAHFIKGNGAHVSWEQLKLCGGTVFNQIIIWKPHNEEESNHVEEVISLSGHNGVIFNISYNPATQLLLSASDDRSIRVWDCPCLAEGSQSLAFNDTTSRCLCTMYGHEARVWKVKSFRKNGQTYISSVAEDGHCIIWKLSVVDNKMSSLIVRKMNFRSNLLSMALNDSGLLAIGGIDGSVRLLDFVDILHPLVFKEAKGLDKGTVGVIKSIKLLTQKALSVLAHTDAGVLLLYAIDSDHWTILQQDDTFGSYAIMDLNENENLVAFGNTKGCLKVVRLHTKNAKHEISASVQLPAFQGKVLSVTWFQSNLFVSGPNGVLNWYLVGGSEVVVEVVKVSSFLLPHAKHRWHTAVLILTFDPQMIVCGDRRGSLHTFVKGKREPTSTFHGVHGKLGVTSLKQDGDLVVSTGRDGHWRKWGFEPEMRLQSKHRASQGMGWIEGCDVINCNKEKRLYVHGFHGNKFVVWSQFSGDELLSVLCGGGHRSWDFSIRLSKFVFLKAGKLNLVETISSISKESVVDSPLHSQHINCVRHLASYNHNDVVIHIVATAGEDTKVILSAIVQHKDRKQAKFQTLCVIDDHLSNVRCIATVAIADSPVGMETMMYTAGGRASLNAYRIKLSKSELPVKIHVKDVASYTSGAQEPSEMRFMDVTAWSASEGGHKVVVACSDGRMRMFQIGKNKSEFITLRKNM